MQSALGLAQLQVRTLKNRIAMERVAARAGAERGVTMAVRSKE